jgi:hypothetical protein
MKRPLLFVLLLASGSMSLLAQTSASYQLTESIFNAGGNPAPVLTSTSYQVTLDSVGDSVSGANLSSESYNSSPGFPAAYPPPGEVLTITFTDKTTLTWTPEGSTGTYNLYRGFLSDLPLPTNEYGECHASGITSTQATIAGDPDPGPGVCFIYLVTAENRLAEEGTKGADSEGNPHPNATPCP